MKVEQFNLLPNGFDLLADEAESNGHYFLKKMQEDWLERRNLFDRPGEALFAVIDEAGMLIGVGGLNVDPYSENSKVGRVRHVYISKRFQKTGLGKLILHRILEHAKGRFDLLRLRTHNPEAVSFYLSLGFELDKSQNDPTHFYFIKKLF